MSGNPKQTQKNTGKQDENKRKTGFPARCPLKAKHPARWPGLDQPKKRRTDAFAPENVPVFPCVFLVFSNFLVCFGFRISCFELLKFLSLSLTSLNTGISGI